MRVGRPLIFTKLMIKILTDVIDEAFSGRFWDRFIVQLFNVQNSAIY